MGKTSIVLNIAEHVGANLKNPKDKKPMLIFSMEMSAQQISQNMLCSAAKIDAHLMRTGTLSDDDWSKLPIAMGDLSESAIFIDDTPGLGLLEIRAKARRFKLQYDIQMVIIDYLQLMEGRSCRKQTTGNLRYFERPEGTGQGIRCTGDCRFSAESFGGDHVKGIRQECLT